MSLLRDPSRYPPGQCPGPLSRSPSPEREELLSTESDSERGEGSSNALIRHTSMPWSRTSPSLSEREHIAALARSPSRESGDSDTAEADRAHKRGRHVGSGGSGGASVGDGKRPALSASAVSKQHDTYMVHSKAEEQESQEFDFEDGAPLGYAGSSKMFKAGSASASSFAAKAKAPGGQKMPPRSKATIALKASLGRCKASSVVKANGRLVCEVEPVYTYFAWGHYGCAPLPLDLFKDFDPVALDYIQDKVENNFVLLNRLYVMKPMTVKALQNKVSEYNRTMKGFEHRTASMRGKCEPTVGAVSLVHHGSLKVTGLKQYCDMSSEIVRKMTDASCGKCFHRTCEMGLGEKREEFKEIITATLDKFDRADVEIDDHAALGADCGYLYVLQHPALPKTFCVRSTRVSVSNLQAYMRKTLALLEANVLTAIFSSDVLDAKERVLNSFPARLRTGVDRDFVKLYSEAELMHILAKEATHSETRPDKILARYFGFTFVYPNSTGPRRGPGDYDPIIEVLRTPNLLGDDVKVLEVHVGADTHRFHYVVFSTSKSTTPRSVETHLLRYLDLNKETCSVKLHPLMWDPMEQTAITSYLGDWDIRTDIIGRMINKSIGRGYQSWTEGRVEVEAAGLALLNFHYSEHRMPPTPTLVSHMRTVAARAEQDRVEAEEMRHELSEARVDLDIAREELENARAELRTLRAGGGQAAPQPTRQLPSFILESPMIELRNTKEQLALVQKKLDAAEAKLRESPTGEAARRLAEAERRLAQLEAERADVNRNLVDAERVAQQAGAEVQRLRAFINRLRPAVLTFTQTVLNQSMDIDTMFTLEDMARIGAPAVPNAPPVPPALAAGPAMRVDDDDDVAAPNAPVLPEDESDEY